MFIHKNTRTFCGCHLFLCPSLLYLRQINVFALWNCFITYVYWDDQNKLPKLIVRCGKLLYPLTKFVWLLWPNLLTPQPKLADATASKNMYTLPYLSWLLGAKWWAHPSVHKTWLSTKLDSIWLMSPAWFQ